MVEGRAIRLAFFIDSLAVGGSELNAIRTLEHLDRSRFELTVFHMGARGPLLARYAALGVPMVRVALKNFRHPSAVGAGIRLIGELKRRRIQILHSHDIYSNIFSVPWARLAKTPVVLASKRWQHAVPSRIHVLANRIASRMATGVLANSEAVARSLIEDDAVPSARIQVIPNFVGPEAFEDFPAQSRMRLFRELGIPGDALVLGVVARLSPVKDHAMLLRALPGVFAAHPEVHVLLIGDGPSRSDLETQVASSGLARQVHFAGTLPNKPNPHGLLDISILPSRTEGFPNSVVEAMAAGRPVVATNVGGTAEAVLPEHTGLLVPPEDEHAMAWALQRLISAPEKRRVFGTAARARARRQYHVDVVLGRLSEWYALLLARN